MKLNFFKNSQNSRPFILVDEVVFVETDSIGWYKTYQIKHYLDSENTLSIEDFSAEDQKVLLSFIFASFLFLSFLASTKVAHGVSGVGVIGMSNGTLLKNKTENTFSFFYNLCSYENLNNYVRYGRKTVSKVYPSSYTNTNSIQANVNIKNPSKEDLFILFQIVNTVVLKKSNLIRNIKKVSINYLNISYFKNPILIDPIYSQIRPMNHSSISFSLIEIIGKEIKKLLITYVILDGLKLISKDQDQDLDKENFMDTLRPFPQKEGEEEKSFEQFLIDSGIDINDLSPKQLNRLKNKWRRWRRWGYGWKSLVSFLKYLWHLFFKKVKSFKEFCKEFIQKIQKNSYLILILKVILSISMILLLSHFYLKKLNILKKENLILLSELKNVTKDFQKKLVEILGEKKLLSDNLYKKLLAIVEQNKNLQKLLESCELTSKENTQRMASEISELQKKYQTIVDQILNRT